MNVRFLLAAVLVVAAQLALVAGGEYGQVTFAGVPVPGVTVTATRGDARFVTTTDEQGIYRFDALTDGTWTMRVEMVGFSTLARDVTVAPDAMPETWALTLLPFEAIRAAPSPAAAPRAGPSTAASAGAGGVSAGVSSGTSPGTQPQGSAAPPTGRAGASSTAAPSGGGAGANRPPATSPPNAAGQTAQAEPAGATPNAANSGNPASPVNPALLADGLLVNGSVNNGAASPFAQLAAFGNNRRGTRSLYNWGLGVVFDNSLLDARPYSFAGEQPPKPSYNDLQLLGTFGGPVKLPGVAGNRPNVFLAFQRTTNHNASTQSGIVPTAAQRTGDFSQSPIPLIDPTTGQPFPGNLIPAGRISSQASALLNYYPLPNIAGVRYNYQTPVLLTTAQDAFQSRITDTLNNRNQLYGNLSYQRGTTDNGNIFNFTDSTVVSGVDAAINWSHRFSPFASLRVGYHFTELATDITPFFSGVSNVSGDAGISGNDQNPLNWGPPSLVFSSGLAGLASAEYASNHDLTHAWSAESSLNHGRHNFTAGGDVRFRHLDVLSQQNGRGTLGFTGAATGSDLADFLLGFPHTSAIALGNPDKYLRSTSLDAYVTDDWRITPTFTTNIGVRWEFEAPMTEVYGRLVNLDIAPGFSAVNPVVASNPVGTLTGTRYPSSLLYPDRLGFEPRLALAWRPIPGSSAVIRAGYGIYRNTGEYQSIAMLLAQQPPLSTTSTVASNPANPLTLANPFVATSTSPLNTFAVDPNFRDGYAHSWQVSLQRDLPQSLTMIATYLGTRGSRLMQEYLPNTYPVGVVNPCPSCPSGFVYLASNGESLRNAGQFQLRRRLRSGFAATVQYTLSKSTDNAGALGGASVSGSAVAQNWLDLAAERGPSNFDQRHLVTADAQYTTGMGVAGGALLTGVKGALLKGWTITGQLSAGSGLPLTPVYLAPVAGTGVTGTIRASSTGAPVSQAPGGYYFNPLAFKAPGPGTWGDAGRNSLRGPATFSLNASLGRSFLLGERLTLDWRFDATNVLNEVTYANVNTIVGSPQFGLATQANPMRKLQSSIRLRF